MNRYAYVMPYVPLAEEIRGDCKVKSAMTQRETDSEIDKMRSADSHGNQVRTNNAGFNCDEINSCNQVRTITSLDNLVIDEQGNRLRNISYDEEVKNNHANRLKSENCTNEGCENAHCNQLRTQNSELNCGGVDCGNQLRTQNGVDNLQFDEQTNRLRIKACDINEIKEPTPTELGHENRNERAYRDFSGIGMLYDLLMKVCNANWEKLSNEIYLSLSM